MLKIIETLDVDWVAINLIFDYLTGEVWLYCMINAVFSCLYRKRCNGSFNEISSKDGLKQAINGLGKKQL